MTNEERAKILQEAADHQFDDDDNADLKIDTDDPLLRAAVRWWNHYGGWDEIMIAPSVEMFEALEMAQV